MTAEGETSAARTQVNLTVSDSEKTLLQQLDGLYLTNADFEVNSDSVRRFEQRCIQSGEDSYFRRDNKELKLDNKLFDTKIYKKVDISLSRNSFLGLKRRNAVICERLNQKKNKYYLIEMFVG